MARAHYVLAAAAAIVLAAPAAAGAAPTGSIVYDDGNDLIQIVSPDGSRHHQVTTTPGLLSPSMADDGSILAAEFYSRTLQKMDANGHALAPAVATSTKNQAGSNVTYKGPWNAAISPDGVRQAYAYSYDLFSPYGDVSDSAAKWGFTDRYDEPAQTVGTDGFTDPSWIDNETMLLTRSRADFLTKQVAYWRAGGGDNTQVEWFSDSQEEYVDPQTPNVATYAQGQMNRQHTRMAFLASVYYTGDGDIDNQIRVWRMTGEPPAQPVMQCVLTHPNGGKFSRPTWSPDGRWLAWAEGDGVHVAEIGERTDCDAIARPLIAAGGFTPYWGTKDVPPAVPGGGGPGTTPGGAGPGTTPGGSGSTPEPVSCVVPRLTKLTLGQAKKLLVAAHCKLGKVVRKRGRRLVVREQSPRPRAVKPNGTKVRLTLAPRR
jgi:hypothetical protein